MMRTAKKTIAFMPNRRLFWLTSVVIMAVGLIANILMGVRMDIELTGGTMLVYSYPEMGVVSAVDVPVSAQPSQPVSGSQPDEAQPAPTPDVVIVSAADWVSGGDAAGTSGTDVPQAPQQTVSAGEISFTDAPLSQPEPSGDDIQPDYSTEVKPEAAGQLLSKALGERVTVQISTDAQESSDGENKRMTVSFESDTRPDAETDETIRTVMERKYPNVVLTLRRSGTMDASLGREFLWKCVAAFTLAVGFMLVYVGLRFRGIGGRTAAVSAIIAVIHDCLVAYFTFVLFRFPVSDHFIAVVLAIIGHSLNSTIVVFDRIRENRRLLGDSIPLSELADRSINESMGRTVCTDLCVFIAVAALAAAAAVSGLSSVLSFAVPMMFGVVSGCYSSLCIGSTIWVTWQETVEKRRRHRAEQSGE